ncbi:MAG: molybdopterin molybdotransferase MoeA [Sphingopyxis solisilvae]|uniref:molybdopterin molybdotransferase MoeA n=1 Tax=Sphingopyxis solisilvae TaxID=1886788 RepID=UPI004036A229
MAKLSEIAPACAASIDFDSALAVLAAAARPLDPVAASLSDAGGCHLAAPIHALLDSPRHACAAMDGYAVRDCDLSKGAATFRSIGVSYAGSRDVGEIGPGETMRVMTGAPVPRGADRVVMIENCRQSGCDVRIEIPPLGKPHIRLRGSDFALGQLLIPKGRKVTPAVAVSVAAADHHELLVSPRPRIQLVATGDEIVAPGSAAGGAFVIPDSLSAAIELLCHSAGATVVSRVRLRDDPDLIARAMESASADIIVVLGGASRGDRDHGRAAFAPLGLEIAFADVAMKPGKPVWYGKVGARHVLGLPGNPTAALTTARLFLAPLITRLLGGDVVDALPWQLLPALGPIEANGPREAFLCAVTSFRGVEISDRQDASGQARLAVVNALVRRPANAPSVLPGMPVPTLPLCC